MAVRGEKAEKRKSLKGCHDGTPCAVKAACTVWSGGKAGERIKGLPIAIDNNQCDDPVF